MLIAGIKTVPSHQVTAIFEGNQGSGEVFCTFNPIISLQIISAERLSARIEVCA